MRLPGNYSQIRRLLIVPRISRNSRADNRIAWAHDSVARALARACDFGYL